MTRDAGPLERSMRAVADMNTAGWPAERVAGVLERMANVAQGLWADKRSATIEIRLVVHQGVLGERRWRVEDLIP